MCFSAQPNAQVRQPHVNRFPVVARRREAPVRPGAVVVSFPQARSTGVVAVRRFPREWHLGGNVTIFTVKAPAYHVAPRRRSTTHSLRDRRFIYYGTSLRGRGRLSAPQRHRIPLHRLSVERRREHQIWLCAAPKGAVFSSVARSGPPTVDLAAERAPSDGRVSLRASGASHPLVSAVNRLAVDEEGSIARLSYFRRRAFDL